MRAPAYARELIAVRSAGAAMNVYAHVGRDAWARAQAGGHQRIVVDLDVHPVDDFDFTILAGLDVTLIAVDADIAIARQIAVRMCAHGARMTVIIHPSLPRWTEFVYCDGGAR